MDTCRHPCIVHLQTNYNDCTEVEPDRLALILKTLDRQFGGWTHLGSVTGSWHGQVEPMIRILIVVPEAEIERLRDVVRLIGRDLKQREMYFEIGSGSVEFLKGDG